MLRLEPLSSCSTFNLSHRGTHLIPVQRHYTDHINHAVENLYPLDVLEAQRWIYIVLSLLIASSFMLPHRNINPPTAGRRSIFEPTWLLKLRFITNSRAIIQDGYSKFKDGSFVVKRLDSDLMILSNKYLEELRLFSNTKLSNVHSQVNNMLGKYTYSTFLLHSDQHVRVLQNHLVPNLKTFLSRSAEEMEYSFQNDMPTLDDWAEVDIQKILQKMIARISSRVFVGESVCRNETWLQLCLDFPINVFSTAFIMRLFPPFLYPVISWLVPTRYWLRQNLALAKQIATPLITSYQSQGAESAKEPGVREKHTLLEWMIDNAVGNEAHPDNLIPRLMFLSLASIHSTSSATSAAIFDLCAHPEYIEPLRAEILDTIGTANTVCKEDLHKLWKLDSFLKESQRCNPPTLLSPQRYALTSLTLSDGTHIPANSTIAFPSAALFTDPELVHDPQSFDGFRAYRKRMQSGEAMRHLMVSTDKDHLYFGHGKQACPGRFFAANEIKMIMIRFLMDFEFRYPKGKGKPETWTVDEMCFLDWRARVDIRRRGDA